MDEPLADIRLFCIGRCGRFVVVPVRDAIKLITVQGDYVENCIPYVCSYCLGWFNRVTAKYLVKGAE